MKTTLTLKEGAFYFLSTVHLSRDVPVEVDLSTLPPAEVQSILLYTRAGTIESSKDLSDFSLDLNKTQTKGSKETKVEEKTKVEEETEEASEEQPEEKKDYSKMVKKELKAELDKRGITAESNRNEDLIKLLEEDDAK